MSKIKRVKRDIVIHYDEENQKIFFCATETSNTKSILQQDFGVLCPDVDIFKSLSPEVAEQKIGALLFALIDLYSNKKITIRRYESEIEEALVNEGLDE